MRFTRYGNLIHFDILYSDCNDRENAILNDHDILEEGEDVEEKNGIDEVGLSTRPVSPKTGKYRNMIAKIVYINMKKLFWLGTRGVCRQKLAVPNQSIKKTVSESVLTSQKRTIYTAGRPPWYNTAGQQVEPFVIGNSKTNFETLS